jgi:transposase
VVNLKELTMILELHEQGLSISAIALRTGFDRKTVRKYIKEGLVVPRYSPRAGRSGVLTQYEDYLEQRVGQWPELSGARLLREIRELGYAGGATVLKDFLKQVRPAVTAPFEVRYETPAGQQAQVDFAHFEAVFTDEPSQTRRIWLFSMVLGHCRYLWGQFVVHQDLATVLRCHMLAFEHLGGAPRQILYDRMKTAVLGERYDGKHIVYNDKLLALGAHYGFSPRACKAYRPKTKGKVERPFRYIRADFFMGRSFANLDDLNRQLRLWLDTVANARVHGTTDRVVAEHLAQERPQLLPLPSGRFDAVLQLTRRISSDGMVSVGGNDYSVPNGTRRVPLEVELTAHEVRILDGGVLLAVHPILTGRNQRSVLAGHRRRSAAAQQSVREDTALTPGHAVARRSLAFYAAVAEQMGRHRSPAAPVAGVTS